MALGNLFNEEAALPGTIGRHIMRALGQSKCISVSIFGSYARGEATLRSDLDVLVLLADSGRVPQAKATLQANSQKFYDLFGLHLSPYVIGTAEFAARLKKGDKLMKAMVREARVISGKPLAEVSLGESEENRH